MYENDMQIYVYIYIYICVCVHSYLKPVYWVLKLCVWSVFGASSLCSGGFRSRFRA